MALNRKTFKKAAAAADTNLPSGYFNTVTYTGNGGTQRIGGYINRGAVFNGSSSTISTTLPNNDIESFSFWMYFVSGTTNNRPLGSTVGSSAGNLSVEVGTNGAIVCNIQNLQAATSSGALGSTGWKHIYYDTGRNLYINGALQSITNSSTSFPSSNLLIGALRNNYGFFNSKLDQVRIFNKALSSNEVTTLYGETHASTTISTTDIFSDNSGVALYQLDGNANDTGGVSGYIGEGAIFNGSSGGIDLSSNTPISNQINGTVSLWFNVLSNTKKETLIRFANNDEVLLRININGTLDLIGVRQSNASYISYTTSGTYNDGAWHHLVMTRESGSIKFYIDDNLDNTLSWNNTFVTASNETAIGWDGYTSSSTLTGKIDQVRIYDKTLSSSEVTTLYGETASSNITISDLVAYYPMEGTSLDQEGSYHGTDTNVEYNYNGTATNVTYQDATNFSPDLVWIKSRNASASHVLSDSVRGANLKLRSNSTAAEAGTDYGVVTSFDSNGFSVGGTIDTGDANYLNRTYAAWCFNAGTDAAVSGTSSQATNVTLKANPDAGFSIIKFTTSASTVQPPHMNYISHGLNAAPEMVIYKRTNAAQSWIVQHDGITTNGAINLDLTNAQSGPFTYDFFDNTSTDIGARSNYALSRGEPYIAYAFHSVDGIQKVGSYTGTGSANNIIETGFQPRFILIKRTDTSGSGWGIFDSVRGGNLMLRANASDTEADGNNSVSFTSNGFTLPETGVTTNTSGGSYIYLAIAADPDTTTPTVEDSFEVVTYTGTGSTQSIDTGFKPDLVWIKQRSGTASHSLQDTVRGAGQNYNLYSDNTAYEGQYGIYGYLSSFDTNGFTVEAGSGSHTNANGSTYVAWCWKAGDHDDNLPQINTEGTIDSTVSVNDAAGFSIVKWKGGGVSGQSVGHGLSSAPELIIQKRTNIAGDWECYHKDLGATKKILLNSSAAASTSTAFGNTTPTSTVFYAGAYVNDLINYCFTSITGYQKIGSYTASSGDDVVTTGFKPRFVMLKRTDSAGHWEMHDAVRFPSLYDENGASKRLRANDSGAEALFNNSPIFFTDTGFTLDSSVSGDSYGDYDANGGTYIYLAIK